MTHLSPYPLIVGAALLASAGPATPPPAGAVRHVAVLTTSSPATYNTPSGAFQPMPATSVSVSTSGRDSLLVITFSARGTVAQSRTGTIPIVFIKCDVDGTACEPDANEVEFLYPQFCCDTRAFTWAVRRPKPGSHAIGIMWGMGNPTQAVATNRSLVVEVVGP
ncbi:MAG TPA: hypothetical protein VEU55_03425 [Gemmatimonadales bacterium]|nr:hypothetical protein [Gemmatimonadales bacterium]